MPEITGAPGGTPRCLQLSANMQPMIKIVEGVIVEQGSVISMGVFIGQSTRIYNRDSGEVTYGRVPAGSIVVSGSLPAGDGSHSLYCAVIVKQVDDQTRAKTGLNDLIRQNNEKSH